MWRTIGHERAVHTLERGMREGRLSHAYLLVGPARVGKMTLALDLARLANCVGEETPCGDCHQCRRITDGLHPDVQVVGVHSQTAGERRDRVTIGIDQVREVQRDASLKPYEGRCRVFVIDGAESLTEEAANSLLNILEEPPEQVILVLLASDVAGLLPTIVSRCQTLELRPLPLSLLVEELVSRHGATQAEAEEIARLSGGRPGWALQALGQPELLQRRAQRFAGIEATLRGGLEDRFSYAANLASTFTGNRESAHEELQLWLEWWRDVLVIKEGVPRLATNQAMMETLQEVADSLSSQQIAGAIEAVRETWERLERNISPRLVLEELVLTLPRP